MNKHKLLRIADMLEYREEEIKEEGFSMDYWRRESPKCGTTCCAIGHGVECGILDDLEFEASDPNRRGVVTFGLVHSGDRRVYAFDAVASSLGINPHEAQQLFGVSNYPGSYHKTTRSPRKVAAGIRRFVREQEAGVQA